MRAAHACVSVHKAQACLWRDEQFTQLKADSEIRWAVLNLVTLLRRHARVHARLAEAMSAGRSVGECIGVVEAALAGASEI